MPNDRWPCCCAEKSTFPSFKPHFTKTDTRARPYINYIRGQRFHIGPPSHSIVLLCCVGRARAVFRPAGLLPFSFPSFQSTSSSSSSCPSSSHSGNIIRACLGTGWMEHAVAKVIHGETKKGEKTQPRIDPKKWMKRA